MKKLHSQGNEHKETIISSMYTLSLQLPIESFSVKGGSAETTISLVIVSLKFYMLKLVMLFIVVNFINVVIAYIEKSQLNLDKLWLLDWKIIACFWIV